MKTIMASTFDENADRYMAEIELQAMCKNSPHIVHYKEYFAADDEHCIVMEYMPAGDLHQ